MKTIVLASNNKHKIKEFKEMLPEYNVLSLSDINYTDDIEETGEIVGGGESQHSQNGKITRLDYNATIKDVVLKNGQKCDITFLSDPINDDYPDYKGIELIGVHFEDGSKDFYVGK